MTLFIVDAYNLIRQSDTLSQAESKNLEKGRNALIQQLAAYRTATGHKIIMVFDAANTDKPYRDTQRVSGMEVIYSQSGETADDVIKELLENRREERVLVSSDRELMNWATRYGGLAISAGAFERSMEQAIHMNEMGGQIESDYAGGRLSTKKKGPAKRRPKRERKVLARLR